MTLKHPLWEALGAILTQSAIPAKSLKLFSLGIPLGVDWAAEPPHDYYSNSFLRNENIIIRELGQHGYDYSDTEFQSGCESPRLNL